MAQDLEFPPSFDDTLVSVAKSLGVTSPLIIGLIVLAFRLKSWLDGIQGSARVATKVVSYSRAKMAQLGPPGVALASAISLISFIAQAATLGLVYLAGNFISIIVNYSSPSADLSPAEATAAYKLEIFESAWSDEGISGIFSARVIDSLTLDIASAIVLLFRIAGLLGSYSSAKGRSSAVGWPGLEPDESRTIVTVGRRQVEPRRQCAGRPGKIIVSTTGAVASVIAVVA